MKSFKLHLIIIISVLGLSSCEKTTYKLVSSASPSQSGVVTPSSGSYEEGDVITLVAQPNNGWVFQKWEGDVTGTTNSASVTMNSNKNVVAVFLRRDYPLTITIAGEGTVQEKIISTPSKSYPFETIVELTPVPNVGWMFDGWGGDLSGIDYPKNITINDEKIVTAKFVKTTQVFGGSKSDYCYEAIPTKDGGYVVIGSTDSNDGIFAGSNGLQYSDIFVLKFDSKGEKQWLKKIGGSKFDYALRIIQAKDDGYIIMGDSNSNDGDFTGLNNGGIDTYIVKLNSGGDKLWINTIGGTGDEYGYSIVEASDGSCFILGVTQSNDLDFGGLKKGNNDIFVTKINNVGQKVWVKSFGGSDQDYGYDIINAHDNGLIIIGDALSNDGDFSSFNKNVSPFLMKINIDGNIQWISPILSDVSEMVNKVIATKDGGYISVGSVFTDDLGYVTSYHRVHIVLDLLIRKYNSQGNLIWKKQFGGSKTDEGINLIETKDNDLIIVGETESNDRDFINLNKGNIDVFAMKLNVNGEKIWVKTFGGSKNEGGPSISLSADGKILIAGYSNSTDGDFDGKNMGSSDIFIINLR